MLFKLWLKWATTSSVPANYNGGTYNLFAHTLPRQAVEAAMAAYDDFAGLEALIDDNTRP